MTDSEKIHAQCLSKDPKKRIKALGQLEDNFSQLSDKQQAYNDLIRLFSDQDDDVRAWACQTLIHIFTKLPDKQQACSDLIRLISDKDRDVRVWAFNTIIYIFSEVPDKQQACNGLIRLISNPDTNAKLLAVRTLIGIFSHVPDKQQACNDLIELNNDKDFIVRYIVVDALGSIFSQLPDQKRAWNVLIKLTSDLNVLVRSQASYALGKASIFEASQAENEEKYKENLENAIEFFEKASKDSSDGCSNPAKFCLPFYRSFHTIIFKKQAAKEEDIDKYLEEAKAAAQGSKSKEELFNAVENLATALREVQKLENRDLETIKSELNLYRKYCDRAEQFMRANEETAPFAVRTIKRGLPILDKNLKSIIKEIQEKTGTACKELQGTPKAEVACSIYRKAQKLEISNPEELNQGIEDIAYTLSCQIMDTPENKYIHSKLSQISSEIDLTKKVQILSYVTEHLIGQMLRENKVSLEIHGDENNYIINSNDSIINVKTKISDIKKPFVKKILSSIVASLGIAGTFFALSYPVCEIYNLENQNIIYIEVFTISFLVSIPIIFLIIEK